MKALKVVLLLTILLTLANISGAQPQLLEINFLVDGQSVDTTSFADVTVQLVFDRDMDVNILPVVNFGLSEPLNLNVPTLGQGWISSTIFQGFFTVSNINPDTGDGNYIFEVFGARDSNGNEMVRVLSTVLNKTLHICRSGELQLSITLLDFGTISAGTSEILNLTISNQSCADLNITNISVPSSFSLTNSLTTFTIPGGDNRVLGIVFSPDSRSDFDEQMVITSNDRFQSTHTVQLVGSASGPQIGLSPSSVINFGKIEVGFSFTKAVQVHNEPATNPALSEPLEITSITTNNSVYSLTTTSLTLAPDETAVFTVTFEPTEYRLYNGFLLTINSNDFNRPIRTLELNGDSSDQTAPDSLKNLTININDFNGFTNLTSLPICWDNPSDSTGIAEIWWKFTTSPTQPQSPDDTTAAGGRFVLPTGVTCENLPLFGKLTSGFWYFYAWLVDGSGNSGYLNAVQTSFVYDINPPGIPTISARSIGEQQWFGSNVEFKLTIDVPVDASRGIRDASEVRWKFKDAPETAEDYNGKYAFESLNNETVMFDVPFAGTELCGIDSLYFWLADSSGNVSADSFQVARYQFDICAPIIKRVLPDTRNIATLGAAYRDTVSITDDAGVDTAWVRYRFGGAESEEPPRSVTRIGVSDNFLVEIPQPGVTRRGLEYRVIAVDIVENKGQGPTELKLCEPCPGDSTEDELFFPVRTRIEGDGDFRTDADGQPVPLFSGEEEANYQLISMPYDLDNTSLAQVLEDDLGVYDNTLWRIFDYKPENPEASRFLEGPDARPFQPGRSFFIITRKENIVLDSGPGVTRRTVCPDSIRVYEGWNLIATPFNFPVSRESLSLINSNSTVTLRSFERGWNISEEMEPWKGYAIFVTRPSEQSSDIPMYLVVKPKAAPGRFSKENFLVSSLESNEWMIQIFSRMGQLHDLENWAGVRDGAEIGYDRLELAEPLVIGKYLSVAFPHPEWNLPTDEFSTDLRPTDSDEQIWNFTVKTNASNELITLDFSFLGNLPGDAKIYLIDEALKISQNLRANPEFSFKSGNKGSDKAFKLIVGSQAFASTAAGEIGLIPDAFELLQNFPNPFNPETTIRYNLPESSQVRLEIFDLLGRRVTSLVDNQRQEAGFYTISWNGRDDSGRQVASGVYIYRMIANSQTISQKMILMK